MSKYLKNDAVKQVARNLIMNAAQSEKAKAGRVTMPKVFLVVGSVEFAVMIALAFFSLLSAHLPAFAVIFGVFSLAGLALVIVYFNQRIYYTNEMLVYKNFFGIKRACRYDELTGIVIEKDVKLFAGEKKFNIDSMAVGRKEFLRCAEAGYYRAHQTDIPIVPRPKDDIFKENIKDSEQFVCSYIIIAVCLTILLGLCLYGAKSDAPTENELRVSTVTFERCEVRGERLLLYNGGEKYYCIPYYKELIPDADKFLDDNRNGGTLTLGFIESGDPDKDSVGYYAVYTVESDGKELVTLEKTISINRVKEKKPLSVFASVMIAVWLLVMLTILASIYVGRHVKELSPKVVRIFFRSNVVNWPDSMKTPSEKKRK